MRIPGGICSSARESLNLCIFRQEKEEFVTRVVPRTFVCSDAGTETKLHRFPQPKRKSLSRGLGIWAGKGTPEQLPLLHPIHSLLAYVFETVFKTAAETRLIVTD